MKLKFFFDSESSKKVKKVVLGNKPKNLIAVYIPLLLEIYLILMQSNINNY